MAAFNEAALPWIHIVSPCLIAAWSHVKEAPTKMPRSEPAAPRADAINL